VSTTCAGVLALQGAVEPHREALARLGTEARAVRTPADLEGLTHLVLPGGESTTVRHLLDLFGLAEPLARRHRAGRLALFGTCAGAILLGRLASARPATLALLDARLERNAYGNQVDSFTRALELARAEGGTEEVHGVFLRAPRVRSVGPGVRVLARLEGEPVALAAPALLATTFHPELSGSLALHRRFLALDPRDAAAPAHAARGA